MSSTSSPATERSFEKLSMLPLKTSVSAGHSALQNAGTEKWEKEEKIRLWSTLFSSSTSKMIHVIEKKILPPFEERSSERKKNFWLNDDLHDQQRLVHEKKMKLLFSTRISAPKIRTRFSAQERSSLNTRIVDSGI